LTLPASVAEVVFTLLALPVVAIGVLALELSTVIATVLRAPSLSWKSTTSPSRICAARALGMAAAGKLIVTRLVGSAAVPGSRLMAPNCFSPAVIFPARSSRWKSATPSAPRAVESAATSPRKVNVAVPAAGRVDAHRREVGPVDAAGLDRRPSSAVRPSSSLSQITVC